MVGCSKNLGFWDAIETGDRCLRDTTPRASVVAYPQLGEGRVTTLQELASLNNFALYPSITPRWAASIRVRVKVDVTRYGKFTL